MLSFSARLAPPPLLTARVAPPLLLADVENSYAGPLETDTCYLFDSEEGTKYVCTSAPDELAFMLGLEEKDLITGVKPDDLSLIECSTQWSHVGTPQWTCTAAPPSEDAVASNAQAPGALVDAMAIGWNERTWAKRTENAPLTDDGACFIVDESEAPDPSKQWFFCSDPADDDSMQCELVPEWMGTAPDGGHAVWMCSKAKP